MSKQLSPSQMARLASVLAALSLGACTSGRTQPTNGPIDMGIVAYADLASFGANDADLAIVDDGKSILRGPTTSYASLPADVQLELQHILRAQVSNASDPAFGAINDVFGPPSWVVPGEVAVAALVLHKAGRTSEAKAACDYLARVQSVDGSWANQYNGAVVSDGGRYARMTIQSALALAAVDAVAYQANLDKAVAHLVTLMDPVLKGGADDGLICGGRDAANQYIKERWASDNAYAAALFDLLGRMDLRDRVVTGINGVLRTPTAWHPSISAASAPSSAAFSWVDFAPAYMGLARIGVTYPSGLAATIEAQLQIAGGAESGAVRNDAASTRLMPGLGFQASLAWQQLGATAPSASHRAWAEGSGLWRKAADENGDAGGFVDWRDLSTGETAPWWQRFIDTSAYYVMVVMGWHY